MKPIIVGVMLDDAARHGANPLVRIVDQRFSQPRSSADTSVGHAQPIGNCCPSQKVGISEESATVRKIVHKKVFGQRRQTHAVAGRLPKTTGVGSVS